MEINKLLEITKNTSPCYVFDYDVLTERLNKLQELSSKNVTLCYAIKANPFLIPALKDKNILFEVCSPGELSICEKYNVNPEKIVFSGVCKTYEDVERAYLLKVNTITLESRLHCEYLIKAIENNESENHNQSVILRLTGGNQFGMSEPDVSACIQELKKIKNVNIRGIHYFTGTQKKQKKITEEIETIVQYCKELEKTTGITLENIEYGPGLSFDYFNLDNEENNYSEYENFINLIKDSNFDFVIELGRYIASSCGSYFTKIMDLKNNDGKNYCIIDGGINHINYYGQMLGMKLPPVEHVKTVSDKANSAQKYTICGSLCTTGDVILREIELESPLPGDYLVFKNIGAYSITEGIYLFLSHPIPAVYIYVNNELKLVRNQIETFAINS